MEEVADIRTQKRKRNNSDKGVRHLPLVVKDSINRLFERKFLYQKTGNEEEGTAAAYPRPSITVETKGAWEIPQYIAMKNELNDLKNNLNDKDMVTWHEHTRSVNLAGYISQQIKAKLRPEMCTQAWCKFYEIASTYLQIDPDSPFFSVHLCEAPGAFVTSLNHYLLSAGFQGNWSWLATTLNPYYEGNSIRQMIEDDRFIRSSHSNWYFGVDGTGNLMSAENLSSIVQKLKDTNVNLVTADGSIDCQDDPAEQESVVCRLQYCEAISAMHILSPGGTFVLKMFTLFECRSICLMYLLNCVFDKVNVYKPCTSKGGNSEVYVVCEGYKGRECCESYLTILTDKYFGDGEPEGCIFDLSDIPETFLSQHTQCAEFFKDCQMTSIQRNLDLCKVMTDAERSRLDQEKEYCAECFFARYHIEPMLGKVRIMRSNKRTQRRPHVTQLEQTSGVFADKIRLEGKFTGSFQERKLMHQLPWQQKVFQYETFEDEVSVEDNSLWIRCVWGTLSNWDVEGMTLQHGQCVDRIRSSRFCHNYYIAKSQEILDNVQWLRKETETSPELTEMIVKHLLTVLKTALQYTDPGGQNQNQSASKISKHECDDDNSSFISWRDLTESSKKLFQENANMNKHSADVSLTETDSNCNSNFQSQELVSMVTDVKDPASDQGHVTMATANVDCDTVIADAGSSIIYKNNVSGTETVAIATDKINVEYQGEMAVVDDRKVVEDTPVSLKCCWKCYCKSGHSEVCRQLGEAALGTGGSVRLYTVTCDHMAGDFEITEQRQLCETVMDIVKSCECGDTIVIEMGTSLSRVTAGLVYLLYRSFTEIGFVHHHGNLLRRHLVCIAYQHCPVNLHQYLTEAWERMSQCHAEAVLEIVPLYTLLEDTEFTSFLQISNTNLLQSFITTVINKERQLYQDQPHSSLQNGS